MRTIENVDVQNKRVIVRNDLNIAVDDGIEDKAVLKEAAKTINYLKDNGAKIILISELGDPQGCIRHNLRMENIVGKLEKVLDTHVENFNNIIKDDIYQTISTMTPGEIVLLENLGFYKEEYENEEAFADVLARMGDIYVDDDFRVADKEYASNVGITKFLPSYAGLSMKNELDKMSDFINNVTHPFVMLFGGTDPIDKMPIIERFLPIADTILTAGETALAFLKAKGNKIGGYTISDTAVDMAKQILYESENENCQIILPVDVIVSEQIVSGSRTREVAVDEIPEGWFVVDIGPRTFEEFNSQIYNASQVLWNGPVGVYEIPEFEYGTRSIAQSIASTYAKTIIGGTHTVNAINRFEKSQYIDIVSFGGDSFLSYLKAQELPGVEALN